MSLFLYKRSTLLLNKQIHWFISYPSYLTNLSYCLLIGCVLMCCLLFKLYLARYWSRCLYLLKSNFKTVDLLLIVEISTKWIVYMIFIEWSGIYVSPFTVHYLFILIFCNWQKDVHSYRLLSVVPVRHAYRSLLLRCQNDLRAPGWHEGPLPLPGDV